MKYSSKFLYGFLAVVALVGSSAFAQETGLDVGNELSLVHLEGTVMVLCSDPRSGYPGPTPPPGFHSETVYCSSDYLMPSDRGRFVTESGIDADKVVLNALWENGKGREKTADFDSASGKSELMRLWNGGLFDRQLLSEGVNRIGYSLMKKKAVVSQGNFDVTVNRTENRRCPPGYDNGSLRNCMPPDYYCDKYFKEHNYCQN